MADVVVDAALSDGWRAARAAIAVAVAFVLSYRPPLRIASPDVGREGRARSLPFFTRRSIVEPYLT
jgi:hypothetical protein